MQSAELAGKQYELIKALHPAEIPHGTNASEFLAGLDLLCPYGGRVVDFGCGSCEAASELGPKFDYIGLDINPQVAEAARSLSFHDKKITVAEGDVRKIWHPNLGHLNYPMIEGCAAVLALGLMPSILFDDDLVKVFQTAEAYLEPGGRMVIADVLHASDSNPALERFFEGRFLLNHYRTSWLSRYEVNRRIHPDLPDGAFGVARESLLEKNRLDWLRDPDTVEWFIKNDIMLERFARHHRLGNLIDASSRSGLALEEIRYDVWKSRHDQPLSGVKLMFTKSARSVRYNPWYRNMDGEELALARIIRWVTATRGLLFGDEKEEREFRYALKHNMPEALSNDIPDV